MTRFWFSIAVTILCCRTAFGQSAVPSIDEIETAYRSRGAEVGTVIPGVRWERWRIKEVREWSLKFKRVSQEPVAGMLIRQYRVIARSSNTCANYRVTERIPLPPPNPQIQIKPGVAVEQDGVGNCR